VVGGESHATEEEEEQDVAASLLANTKDSSAKINIQNMTQKLPPGQSLITVLDGTRPIMQVRTVSNLSLETKFFSS